MVPIFKMIPNLDDHLLNSRENEMAFDVRSFCTGSLCEKLIGGVTPYKTHDQIHN